MSDITVEVPPLSRADIRDIARRFRKVFNWKEAFFPIVDIFEFGLPRLDPQISFIIGDCDDMGSEHGRTFPDDKVIIIREDIYHGACDGVGRDRLTMSHELGHLILHSNLPFSRQISRDHIPAYRSSEWQANCFGGELLISAEHVHMCSEINDAVELFGVSYDAAATQWEAFKNDGIIA